MIYTNVDQAFVAALVAFVVALVSSPLVYRALVRTQVRQKVSEHVPEHAAKQGTPTMGGIIVLLGLLASFAFVPTGRITVPMVLLIGFALIGLFDDFVVPRRSENSRGLEWKSKIAMQLVVVLGAFLIGGVRDWGALAFMAFVVLFFANSYNFVDGMDALAGGIGVMLAVGFAIVARFSIADPETDLAVLVVMAGIAASLVPFLYYNAPPAKVFMGDVGSLPLGALFGWAFLEVGRPSELVPGSVNLVAAIVISLVLVCELVPVPLQILSVKLRKGKRLFPRTPIHHAFQHAGWPETRVMWMFHLVQAVLVAVAVGVLWRVAG